MAGQERTYTGAKTELKVSKGRFPTPYIHKVFDVTITDNDFVESWGFDGAAHYPYGVPKIRSVFIFSTRRKNTLSVMVVYITPKYNKKGQLIGVISRQKVSVNLVTRKVWQYQGKTSSTIATPPGWKHKEWMNEILKAVET